MPLFRSSCMQLALQVGVITAKFVPVVNLIGHEVGSDILE